MVAHSEDLRHHGLRRRHGSSLYLKLVPLIGDDDANALMSEFPSSEAEELVTRQFLRAELAELRSEMGALENRLTVRLGTALAAMTAVLATLITVE